MLAWRRALLAVACGSLAWCFYANFDLVNLDILLTWIGGILAAGLLLLRGYRRYLLAFVAACLLFLAGGEALFRVYYFGPAGLSPDRYRPAEYGHPFSGMQYDPSTYTGLKPNQKLMFKGAPFTVNSEGFRGRDYSRVKPAGTYRIVMTGASVTLGAAVADDEVASEVVERGLNAANPGKHVEVVNISISASRYGHQLHALREVGMAYDPDLIMFLANESITGRELEVEPKHFRAYNGSRWQLYTDRKFRLLQQRFFFMQLLEMARRGQLVAGNAAGKGIGPYSLGHLFDSPLEFLRTGSVRGPGAASPPPQNGRELMSAAECAEIAGSYANVLKALDLLQETARGVPVALYLLRPMEGAYDVDAARRFRSVLHYEAGRRGMLLIDTYETNFSGYRPHELLPYPGEDHPGPLVHKLIGEFVVKKLLPVVRDGAWPGKEPEIAQ